MINPTKKLTLIVSTLFLVAFLLSGYAWFNYQKSKKLEVVFLDIGQGDSILIKTPFGQNILIDGGPDSTVLYKLGKYLPFYDKTIDLMILTHPHSDHVAGLVDVLKRYKVKRILGAGVTHTSPDYLKWLELIKEKEIEFITASGSREIIFNSKNELAEKVVLKVLFPFSDISQNSFKDLNESSIVVKLIFDQVSFLFMGDLPGENEQELVNSDIELKSTVLKVGHHGSKYSSSIEFLSSVEAEFAVIQSGKDNKFNHPHRRALRNLEQEGITILRNDQLSDIIFNSDGQEISYKVKSLKSKVP